MVAWGAWSVRNGVLHGNFSTKPNEGLARSLQLLNDFYSANVRTQECTSGSDRHGQRLKWTPPPAGFLELNCNASVK